MRRYADIMRIWSNNASILGYMQTLYSFWFCVVEKKEGKTCKRNINQNSRIRKNKKNANKVAIFTFDFLKCEKTLWVCFIYIRIAELCFYL